MLGWLLKPFALASTIALSTLGILSQKYQRARFYFHLILYISTLGAMSIWGVAVSILATLAGQRLNINYYVARSFYLTCSPLVGIKIDVEGEEHLTGLLTARGGNPQSAVLVGNHQSFLDILFIGRIFPKRASIMAKKELKWVPALGQFMSLSGAVFIDRKNRKDAVKALEQAANDMKHKGVSLWVFPEGTRSSSAEPALLPFKKGAFHLAIQAQVPIVPVVSENYHRLFDGRTRLDSGTLRVKVLPAIETIGLTSDDVNSLAEKTRERMLETLSEISAPGPSTSATKQVEELPETSPALEETPETIRQRPVAQASESSESGKEGGKLFKVDSRGDTTEDEMDDDAVLLKRPKVA
ncbi:hypothetical protein BCR39DRAFT_538480 [Naematelia encephala]|uniref:1-acyl-sn-glycerol-3-phosphate acyltransferase n=1 Tax=Naematelia encephala TaxID=71784 RepID=A0A1Y2AXR8_9TREE|nr:hypothetical protein BCR39DRAFT_538480 [Naematelia encephala]